jgi:hypothetical protein
VLYTFDGVKFRQGNGTSTSNQVLLTIDGNKIRQGNGTSSSNQVLYTIEGVFFYEKLPDSKQSKARRAQS